MADNIPWYVKMFGGPGAGAAVSLDKEKRVRDQIKFNKTVDTDPNSPWHYPGQPDPYQSSLSGLTSNVPELDRRLGGIQADQRGLNAFRSEALRSGPSNWASLMLESQGNEQRNMMSDAAARAASGTAAAQSSLAQRGGLGSGAAERLAQAGQRNSNQAMQNVAFQGAQNRLGIQTQDEANRLANLRALPSMDLAAIQPELQKTGMWADLMGAERGQQIADTQARNAYNQDRYRTQMAAWAAGKQAQATQNSGGGGLFGNLF